MQRTILLIALFSVLTLCACQPDTESKPKKKSENETPVVVVVNYPLQFIVESLVGPEFEVLNPVPPDANPETWLPNDTMIQTIQKADLIVTNGANFADWVKKLSLPRSKVLRTSLSLKDALITVPDFEVHSHGTGGAHSHAGTVAFFWLDPALMERQAEAIAQRLIDIDPQQKESIAANLEKLKESLKSLSQKLDQLEAEYPGLHWFSERPVYQYLARRCGWTMHHLHWKQGTNLSKSDWDKLNTMQQEHKIPFLVWEHQPEKERVKDLTEHGVTSVVLDPLTVKPAQGDYVSEMQRQLAQLELFLKQRQTESSKSTN
ncbi:High-affinity zinc uptake system binding-protein ZnuA precursor [Gimesia alba]|uniref:High-affinity zinc uptake system binding-protein ZnuA n=1 Tax=Gimesia alba TaxID=2527973 RepID=A0A517RIU1_9PLAN|nr:metal ABC transporter substrate-binding protein [Gimesia alba]QDT43782.1 High-affinity zinc uptake system binding-protein ZnuA precursor [Gimesia alba]